MAVKQFIKHNFRHFNAAVVVDAAEAYIAHLDKGGKMFMTVAGAMSTAELGISLAEMIRQDKVHAICCTGANLEEDIFNLVAHNHYERVPHYRQLTPKEEQELHDRGMNRVTDTCIPEDEAIRRIENEVLELWQDADKNGKRYFPYEFMYQLLRSGKIKSTTKLIQRLMDGGSLRKEFANHYSRLGRFDPRQYFCLPRCPQRYQQLSSS
jgi:deoxyhypusine synthase